MPKKHRHNVYVVELSPEVLQEKGKRGQARFIPGAEGSLVINTRNKCNIGSG